MRGGGLGKGKEKEANSLGNNWKIVKEGMYQGVKEGKIGGLMGEMKYGGWFRK